MKKACPLMCVRYPGPPESLCNVEIVPKCVYSKDLVLQGPQPGVHERRSLSSRKSLKAFTLDQIKKKIDDFKKENGDLEKKLASWEEKIREAKKQAETKREHKVSLAEVHKLKVRIPSLPELCSNNRSKSNELLLLLLLFLRLIDWLM
ncbi:unnamed protein product [Gulo gulo]|uniref:Uncharacterized protein n=1 Tax=Gulo gulo TaxID=48420 RepID=A0A9X9PUI8_GULGU|nr:unnamed protein product [Gulo gulo]